MIREVRQWFPQRRFRVVGDGFYAPLAGNEWEGIALISRMQRNTEIYDLPMPKRKKQRGRPRKKGRRLPHPERMARHVHQWKKIKVRERGRIKERLVYTRPVLWYRVRKSPALRVIRRDPTGQEKNDFFFTTDETMSPAEVIGHFADHWAVEDTFKQTKQLLGGQEPQTFKGKGPNGRRD